MDKYDRASGFFQFVVKDRDLRLKTQIMVQLILVKSHDQWKSSDYFSFFLFNRNDWRIPVMFHFSVY